jgi:hypothetical protein
MCKENLIVWKACPSYNYYHVPTPFYHLSLAHEISEHPDLSSSLQILLQTHKGAFLLGNTAPDVQVLSGQTRRTTHFFSVPARPRSQVPWQRMLLEYPELNQPAKLSPDNAAFIAGYLCHLQADWIWVLDIFQPIFGPDQIWETFTKRLYLHNVLRAYLDIKVIEVLPSDVPTQLRVAHPDQWLPFIQDKLLIKWRDFLCDQLQPGESIKTVDVFASRQGIDPEEFHSLLRSETQMEVNIFKHLTRQQLQIYRERLVAQSVGLLEDYQNNSILSGISSRFTHYYDRRAL